MRLGQGRRSHDGGKERDSDTIVHNTTLLLAGSRQTARSEWNYSLSRCNGARISTPRAAKL
jgi:hypothetical protein